MHLTDDELVLHFYGEMDAPDAQRAAVHLAACPDCRGSFGRLERVLAAVDTAPEPLLPDGFERTVWARLEPSLAAERRGWLSWFVLSPGRLAWVAAILVLVGGAFFAGRVAERNAAAPQAAAAAAEMRERILMSDLSEHLDRSQMMLVDLVSADGTAALDITAERERAGDLVAANRLYRQTARTTGDAAMTELLDDLERVLVDLAASPDQLSAEDLERVRQRIETRGLLFKVRVLSTSVREKQKQQIRQRTGQSS